ncbi:TonB-dependent receptor [Pseudoalteromonas luteoviolacea]|uniref:TonB-dependent receptor n=1 Tax=Pseudoalteromonas luteoviolacea TaxID=43657 RepID=UPI00114DD091|nr:TonB-dependent receptor [Pseudoalteromonas luteoviolacea]TQF72891.1 TonB-dependent receptor [Pseudoalteromonas luteoviolacea]
MKLKLSLLAIGLSVALSNAAHAEQTTSNQEIETIQVTGDFQQESLLTLSASASVFDETEIETRGASYLDEILNSAANVNFTAGASRGRFVQIRGVGLRSQFVDPITPSVGLLIDGINYSGLGGSSLLFDVDQVAIYRGPQGTKFGADAMGGVIDMHSAAASQSNQFKVKLGAANYGTYEAGIAAGTGITESTAARVSLYQKKSDGYVDNIFLNQDTQDQDERVARIKLNSQLSDDLKIGFTYHFIDIDNGYDGFTLNNSRTSVADQPGKDTQQSDAFAVNMDYQGFDLFNLEVIATGLQADTEYSYDEDWTCTDSSQPVLCEAGLNENYWGAATDQYLRDHERGALEVRLTSKDADWTVGLFTQKYDVDLTRHYSWVSDVFKSSNEVNNHAVFIHKITDLNEQTQLITGLRAERFDSDYIDSRQVNQSTDDTMLGGKVALEYQATPQTMIYTSVNRGYKSGGINAVALASANNSTDLPANFDPEYIWNYEFGVKGQSKDLRHTLHITAFYMDRDNMQLNQGLQLSGAEFTSFISNAADGTNYGIEIEGHSKLSDALSFNYTVGYLETKINDYAITKEDDQGNDVLVSLDGREQAQAPKYQYSANLQYDFSEAISVQVGLEGKDDYYLSDSHFGQAPSHNLINASASYYADQWSLTFWGRNLADRDIPVRGFQFEADPRLSYAVRDYVQYGEPRLVGITFKYEH